MADATRPKERGGNDAPRKAWKTQKPSFPLFPPGLEIRPTTPDSHIPTAPATGLIFHEGRKKDEAKTAFPLTDAGHFRHHNGASVAALRG